MGLHFVMIMKENNEGMEKRTMRIQKCEKEMPKIKDMTQNSTRISAFCFTSSLIREQNYGMLLQCRRDQLRSRELVAVV